MRDNVWVCRWFLFSHVFIIHDRLSRGNIRENQTDPLPGLLGKDSSIGGLAGLVQAFQKNGLGEIVSSWVSTGQNLPITPSQIEQGLDGDLLSQLASRAGLSSGAAGSQLAGLLPDVVDKLTPNGKIEAGGLEQLLKLVQGR
jgi:uncharacterized protein YidB (DUF937 family)